MASSARSFKQDVPASSAQSQSQPSNHIHVINQFAASYPSMSLNVNRMEDLYAANSSNMNDWVRHCKALLIRMECANIETRSNHWSSIVNTQTNHTNHRLNINAALSAYKYSCEPLTHLAFLSEWKGLKMRQITNYPRTYTEFEAKAKNWLNGRRAPNYGATLFPDMIKTAETYARALADTLFSGNEDYHKLYFRVLMYAYLAALCSERITMNNASKRTPLLLENSLKYCKTQTAKMLQNYAQDYPYPHQFPSHLRQAADFFHTKYDEWLRTFYELRSKSNPSLRLPAPSSLPMPTIPAYSVNDNNDSHSQNNNSVITQVMKTDVDYVSSHNRSNSDNRKHRGGETSSHSPSHSHSDSSTASAITPISPQNSHKHHHQQQQQQRPMVTPPIPIPIPFGSISTVRATPTDLSSHHLTHSSTNSSASSTASLPNSLPLVSHSMSLQHSHNHHNHNSSLHSNSQHSQGAEHSSTSSSMVNMHQYMNTNMDPDDQDGVAVDGADDGMIHLTQNEYGNLMNKIESLERTQLHQRQIISVLATKLQGLESKNQSNLHQIQQVNVNTALIPPIPAAALNPQQLLPVSSAPMSEIQDPSNSNNNNNNVMPTIDVPSESASMHNLSNDYASYSHYNSEY